MRNRKRAISVAVLFVCITIVGCSDSDTDPIAGPVTEPVTQLGSGEHTIDIAYGSIQRDYIVYVPASYLSSTPMPLILNLHGFPMTAVLEKQFTNMNLAADENGFIVVYPNGHENSWNGGSCCGDAVDEGIDDVGFLKAVVDDVSTRLSIDGKRVYATGMSNGGFMSHRLGCEASDMFAAVAPVAGALLLDECTPSRPMPIIVFHGDEDTFVSYDSDVSSVARWVEINGCNDTPTGTEIFGGSNCETYEGCNDNVKIIFCSMIPMGHCWPGGSEALCLESLDMTPYNDDIDANQKIWEFFSEYELP